MPIVPYRQNSWGSGELAEELYSQGHQPVYAHGARALRNFFPTKHGIVVNRTGSKLTATAKAQTQRGRIIPFVHSELPNQAYVIELGQQRLRIAVAGGVCGARRTVVLGSGGSGWSDDAETSWSDVGVSGGGAGKCVVSDGTTWLRLSAAGRLQAATRGAAWTTINAVDTYSSLIWTGKVFVAAGAVGATTTGRISVSPTGATWTHTDTGVGAWTNALALPSGAIVVFRLQATRRSLDDGATWTEVSATQPWATDSTVITAAAVSGSTILAWLSGSLVTARSTTEGVSWDLPANGQPLTVTAAGSNGSRVVYSTDTACYFTDDAFATAPTSIASSVTVDAIWWDADRRVFIAVKGTSSYVYDPSAATWTAGPALPASITAATGIGGSGPGGDIELVTPYAESELREVTYLQIGDILRLYHPDHPTQVLTRFAHDVWTLAAEARGAGRTLPTDLAWKTAPWQGTIDATHPYVEQWEYVATFETNGVESLPSLPLWCPASSTASQHHKGYIAVAVPATLQVTPPVGVNYVRFYKGKNGQFGLIGRVPAHGGGGGVVEFEDEGYSPIYATEPPESRAACNGAGTYGFTEPFKVQDWAANRVYKVGDLARTSTAAYRCAVAGISGATGPSGTANGIVDGATTALARNQALSLNDRVRYRGVTLLVTASTGSTSANWVDAISALGATKVDGAVTFRCLGVGEAVKWDYVSALPYEEAPACGAFFGGRIMLGGLPSSPETVFGSRLEDYLRFDYGETPSADDGLEFTLASRKREVIRWLLGNDTLLAGTNSSIYAVTGSGGKALGDGVPVALKQSDVGSSPLHPLELGDDVIYQRVKGSGVRLLTFQDTRAKHVGEDISVYSSHFFDGHEIVEWCYAEDPFSVVWAVRDDGKLLSFTYQPKTGVYAWALHETTGVYESICSIPEGEEDVVYALVSRTNGRYLERFASRKVTDVRLGCFLDSCMTFDGRNTTATTVTVSGTSYAVGASVAITASADAFVVGDVGSVIVLEPDGTPIRLTITSYTSATVVGATVGSVAVPAAYQATPTLLWAWARIFFTGLTHLANQAVRCLADGLDIFGDRGQTVEADGTIQIGVNAVVVHIGLPYVSDLELLDLAYDDRLRGKVKTVARIAFEVVRTLGLKVGEVAASLTAWRRSLEPGGVEQVGDGPVKMLTGSAQVQVSGRYGVTGRALVRQDQPFPATILAVTREVDVSGS